jgi:hypothetical protein
VLQVCFRLLATSLLLVSPAAQARVTGVVAGISHYREASLAASALPGAEADARAVAAALSARGATLTLITGEDATAERIRIAIEQLVAQAASGDKLVIYLSGHGLQVPSRLGDANEADGLDELFLAADAQAWDEAKRAIPGAIGDDAFGAWIARARAKGADIWFIADVCHGGGFSRGPGGATAKRLDPALFRLPPPVRGARADASGLADAVPVPGGGRLVTFYAAPAGALAWERPLPGSDGAMLRRGLFTWSLLRALEGDQPSFLQLAAAAERERHRVGPPGGPAWIGGDLAQPVLFGPGGHDLLAGARAARPLPAQLRLVAGHAGKTCPGRAADPQGLAPPGAEPMRLHGCREVLVELLSSARAPITVRPWYRDAAGSYVALADAGGLQLAPGARRRFTFIVSDRDPASGAPLPTGLEYLLLVADGEAGTAVVAFETSR